MRPFFFLAAICCAPLAATAQNTCQLQFETQDYASIGVYDTWEDSPFRTGALRGNVAIVANPDTEVDPQAGLAPNPTAQVLAVQRSRFGSNTFGARINLAQPFRLTKEPRYMHVMLRKPRAGRVMLIGLGRRVERTAQDPYTEQFWATSNVAAKPDKWCDMVFAINGADGIDINALVVVPDLESTHDLDADFAAYIDNIELNNNPQPTVSYEDYPLNFDKNTAATRSDRCLNAVTIAGTQSGTQRVSLNRAAGHAVYQDLTATTFRAKAGERLTATFDYTGNWMHGYVYVDRGLDGRFSADVNDDYTIADGSDLMTYSCVCDASDVGHTPDGRTLTGSQRATLNPPAFTMPADLANGFYRMRFKVDWSCLDAGGNMAAGNTITANGGGIADVRLNIHGDNVSIKRDGGLNGDLICADGSDFVATTAPFGQPFTVRVKPAPDFALDYIRVRHGYNLQGDSIRHSTRQYADDIFPASLFQNDTYTIPAEYIDGDVLITPEFKNPGGTGINTAATAAPAVSAHGGKGHLHICAEGQHVCVAAADGTAVYSGDVSGQRTLHLPAGVYVVNQRKVVVR